MARGITCAVCLAASSASILRNHSAWIRSNSGVAAVRSFFVPVTCPIFILKAFLSRRLRSQLTHKSISKYQIIATTFLILIAFFYLGVYAYLRKGERLWNGHLENASRLLELSG